MTSHASSRSDANERRWTPRQREVLDRLAKGRTNGEIAAELGISLDGAKWHVSEIITRLDVDTREEAAEYWRQRQGLRARMRVLTRTGRAPVLLRWLAIGGGAAAAVAITAVVAVLVMTPGESNEQVSPLATPAESVTVEPGETPAPGDDLERAEPLTEIGGVPVRELTIGPEVPLPAGTVLYYSEACMACDGGWNPHRAYVEQSGELVMEGNGDGFGLELPSILTSFGIFSDGALMVAQYCDPGWCGGVGGWTEDAVPHAFRSTDGGVTWEEWDIDLPFRSVILGPANGEWLIATQEFDGGPQRYWFWPSGEELDPPSDTSVPGMAGSGEIFWTDYADPQAVQHLDSEGNPLAGMGIDEQVIIRPTFTASRESVIYQATNRDDSSLAGSSGHYVVMTDERTVEAAFRWIGPWGISVEDQYGPDLYIGGTLYPDNHPDARVGGASGMDYRTLMIDFENATVHGIAGLPREFENGRNTFSFPHEIVARGPVLRVETSGSCLNVRDEPSTDGESLRCYVDGVLLFEREGAGDTPDGWVAVTTPDGREGWASEEFLKR